MDTEPSTDDPYRSPTSLSSNRNVSFKPSIIDWIVLAFLTIVVGGTVFLGTCFGSGIALIAVGDIYNRHSMDTIFLLSLALGVAAAFFAVRAVVLAYWKNSKRNYERKLDVGPDPLEATKLGASETKPQAPQPPSHSTGPNDGERK